uniref:Uncharacterized protein n=1 Tax=Amphimedon queenslandica TaxID=400682 RepID=A0A1X7SEC5_AMPQE
LSISVIRDCVRIGRYDRNHQQPRPLLVKFNCSKSVNTIIKRSSDLPQGITVKKHLTKHERYINSVLLRERYRLVTDDGIEKRSIKFLGNQLLVNGRPRGEASATGFKQYPTSGQLTPTLNNIDSSSDTSPTDSSVTPQTDSSESTTESTTQPRSF